MVRYVVQAENGEHITIKSKAYYVPNLTPEVRLICPHGLKTLGEVCWLLYKPFKRGRS